MRQQGSNNRRGPRRPHSGSNGSSYNAGGHSGGGHSASRGEQPRRSAASLRNQSFDSNGPEVRVRGNAWQVHEKYQALARDAQMAGDRVAAENLLQHAEHYYRITEAIEEAAAAEQASRGYVQNAQPDARGLYPASPVGNGAVNHGGHSAQPQAASAHSQHQAPQPEMAPQSALLPSSPPQDGEQQAMPPARQQGARSAHTPRYSRPPRPPIVAPTVPEGMANVAETQPQLNHHLNSFTTLNDSEASVESHAAPRSPFFTPEEAEEATVESQNTRVASF